MPANCEDLVVQSARVKQEYIERRGRRRFPSTTTMRQRWIRVNPTGQCATMEDSARRALKSANEKLHHSNTGV